MASCTRIRLTAVQRWPEFRYEPAAASAAAAPGSASGMTVMSSTSGFVISSSPISAGSPVTTENMAGGSPASYRRSASCRAVSGVFSDGFRTMRLLVAMEGATLCAT